ncbi:hypothetical protein K8I85_17110, partial [bacterium]|nr:hypothetical protein [bacterium]
GVAPGSGEADWLVRPGPQNQIRLAYTLSYDPADLIYTTYAPSVSRDHLHVAGSHWALQIGARDEVHRTRVQLVDAPDDWTVYTSLGPDPQDVEIDASYDDLVSTALGGGRRPPHRFLHGEVPASVFLQGEFAIPDEEMFRAVERIVTSQRDYFRTRDGSFFHVVLLPRVENVAGVRFRNMFVSFLDRDVERRPLFVLLAHEMLHNWIAGDLIGVESGEDPVRYAWIYEGFTEYLARRMLLDDGLLTRGDFVELLDRDIVSIADNPHREATYEDLVAARADGTFDQAFNKLSYYRGALIAFRWDTGNRTRDGGRSLAELLREACQAAGTDGSLGASDFFDLAASYGVDARGDFDRYVLRGEPIVWTKEMVPPTFTVTRKAVPSFDPGFSVRDSYRNGVVSVVSEGGPAYRAGLRNGMTLRYCRNESRFSNAWNPDDPLTVFVTVEGRDETFAYDPHGPARTLTLLDLADGER